MSNYKPPFTITGRVVSLVAEITEAVTLYIHAGKENLRLRGVNRIRTIQGSLAIEGNSLTTEQVTAILEGKPVIGSRREIQEVRNAIKAYDSLNDWNPYSLEHLLEAHAALTLGLIDESGKFRSGGVGVAAGKDIIHIAPPASRVPVLIDDLLSWIATTDEHPLIASSVFHYEFEFIHPFADGNGRVGRLWQTLILSRWKEVFAFLPIENMIYRQQQAYYDAINESSRKGDSAPFIEFLLEAISKAITAVAPEVTPEVTPEVIRLLKLLLYEQSLSRQDIQQQLKLIDEKNVRLRYITPALKAGWIEQTIADKPKSRLQRYRITLQGRDVLIGIKE